MCITRLLILVLLCVFRILPLYFKFLSSLSLSLICMKDGLGPAYKLHCFQVLGCQWHSQSLTQKQTQKLHNLPIKCRVQFFLTQTQCFESVGNSLGRLLCTWNVCSMFYVWGVGIAQWLECWLVIEKSQVQVPAGAVWEFSSPELQGQLSVLTLISVCFPPPCYRSSM